MGRSGGFWQRVEASLLDLQRDPERAARWMRILYWISLGFVLVGVAYAVLVVQQRGGF